jgi:hypothetical protein
MDKIKILLRVAANLSLLLLIGTLCGCGNGMPNEAAARTALEDKIKASNTTPMVKIKSFRKTNGQQIDALGMKGYQLMYEAEAEFLQDGFDPTFGYHRKGETINKNGDIYFTKSEQGWIPVKGMF